MSASNIPDSLTIRLPAQIRTDQTYALWVRTARGEWSDAVKINDARPLWVSPAFTYATHRIGSLVRELKVVGRNLQPSAGVRTQIQLVGPEVVGGIAETAPASDATRGYVARLKLPARLSPGSYQVRVSRAT